ncbi:MAG TPA: hypothetical protein VFV78_12880 [Vicinamibacterales bacterium]|nr:hypothetical protein [Vicinamibacterales bacterium]
MTFRTRCIPAAVGLALAFMGTTLAAQTQYRYSDQQTVNLLDRVARDTRQFDREIDAVLARDPNPNRPGSPAAIDDDVDVMINQLADAIVHLRGHYTRRQVAESDVQQVMIRGARVDQFMRRNRLNATIENRWQIVRRGLDDVARAFNMTWNWSSPNMNPMPGPPFYSRLEGTYQLDRGRSDDPARVAAQATRGLPAADRERAQRNLTARLDAPELLAIDRNGRSVSLASSNAPMAQLDITGTPHSETNPNGGVSTVRADFYGDQLSVTTTGNRGRDFTVTFEPLEGGNGLEVTRTIEIAALTTPVTTRSVYRRTSNRADWSIFHPPAAPPSRAGGAGIGAVPAGTVLVGQLNMALGSRTSRQGDRFTVAVNGPGQFRGAVLQGIVSRVNTGGGRNELIFDFDSIRLRDGRTADFEGVLSQARTPDGRVVLVDREGDVRTGDRTGQTVAGAGIGATIGAIIGAIANGGKGAAIGAAIGGGIGGGAAYSVGSDLDLPRGTELQIISQPIWDRKL